ncbi:hypothetical protein Hypma_015563 [Hypsizygus marmoreus]|uniref:Metal ion transporter C17A12.14 n=1 Tax=Hypsizygus marmoreus TaxID=39966 RepID=A0A369KD30_HYPMA|nr:hypothetical protein Hypma_015563 [Hypsizygus marmoreus]
MPGHDQQPALHIHIADQPQSSQVDDDDHDESDIYRGEPPSPVLTRSPSPQSTVSSSSSSSSSFSFRGRGRLGAIAAVVELAISRWARGASSGSSSSSSSSSSQSSIVTVSRSHRSRVRKRRSVGTLHSLQSERDIAALISRIKAREESRQIPRCFTLYLPPTLSPWHSSPGGQEGKLQRTTWTASLPLLLDQLDAVLKKAIRSRRNQRRNHVPGGTSQSSQLHHDYMLPQAAMAPFKHRRTRAARKDKHREGLAHQKNGDSCPPEVSLTVKPKAWFLDVAAPTWEDMRAIGKLLHLHPLTLEDILQRDPREKLELFPKLGYYFVSFRAIEGQRARDKREAKMNTEALDGSVPDEGILGEANVYLVVFNEGICIFHFTDISEYTDHVRNRIMLLEEVINMSSDWIAHGILDSIVDSFFPILEEIEKEVVAIEDLVLAAGNAVSLPGHTSNFSPLSSMHTSPVLEEKASMIQNSESQSLDEKNPLQSIEHTRTRFSSPRLTLPLALRRFKRMVGRTWRALRSQAQLPQSSPTHTTLRRMARTRKLVTSLARLLATKSEVITQIRKRLLTSGKSGLGNGTGKNEDLDVAIYMGDIQDHILTLQHSLAHYERMLSQSHPTYLSQLRTGVALTKSGTDKAIIYLTTVGIAVLCIQTLIGTFSLNVTVPTNDHSLGGSYHVFGIIVSLAVVILCSYISIVRHWWIQAKRRRGAAL